MGKRAAAQEVKALAASTKRAVAAVRSQAARNAQDAAKDLTRATQKMYSKLASMQARTNRRNARNSRRIAAYSARARAELFQAKKAFGARLSTLTNTVTANNRKTESLLAGLTGLVRDKKAASAKDRALIKAQTATCADKLKEYVAKGKGRNLSSLGDLLNTITGLASVRAGKAEGIGAGASELK